MPAERSLRGRALALLSRREHSAHELRQKLSPFAESAEELQALLDSLTAQRLVSDTRYAEARLYSRAARYGNRRLALELKQKGITQEVIDHAIADTEDELARARALWQKKFGTLPSKENHKEQLRQMRYLLARGFSSSTIHRILRSDFDECDDDCSEHD